MGWFNFQVIQARPLAGVGAAFDLDFITGSQDDAAHSPARRGMPIGKVRRQNIRGVPLVHHLP
jgi:hypothetical protein